MTYSKLTKELSSDKSKKKPAELELEKKISSISPEQDRLNLNCISFCSIPLEAIAQIFKRIPPNIKTVTINRANLDRLEASSSTTLLALLPETVKCLELRGNYDFMKHGNNYCQLPTLPKQLESLDLSLNFFNLSSIELCTAMFRSLELRELGFKSNGLGTAGIAALKDFIKVLPRTLEILNLSHNNIDIDHFTKEEVLDCFAELPPTLKQLNLSSNGIIDLLDANMAQILPPTLETLNLCESHWILRQGDPGSLFVDTKNIKGLQEFADALPLSTKLIHNMKINIPRQEQYYTETSSSNYIT